MKLRLRDYFVILVILAMLAIVATTEASGRDDCREPRRQCGHEQDDGNNQEQGQDQVQRQGQDQEQGQEQDQQQDQQQGQEQGQSTDVDVSNELSNAGNSQSVHFSSPQRAPNTYLQLNNNTESCVRVLGFSFANTGGSGMIGVPLPRGKACDIWKAVNEAQENGHVWLSYAFMCEIKNIRNVWGLERCKELTESALIQLEAIIGAASSATDDMLMAQVSQEEYEEQAELVEYRYAQQQHMIESLEQDHAAKDAEIEKLKREAAELRAAQEAEEQDRHDKQEKLRAILAKREGTK